MGNSLNNSLQRAPNLCDLYMDVQVVIYKGLYKEDVNFFMVCGIQEHGTETRFYTV